MKNTSVVCLSLLLWTAFGSDAAAFPGRHQRAFGDRGASRLRVERRWKQRQRLNQKQRFRLPISTLRRMVPLARDPAHGNKMTKTSKREAFVGIMLEMRGKLPGPIKREKTGASEFVDARGTRWDVKAFNSHWPQKSGGFLLERALRKLGTQFAGGEKVILDTANLTPAHKKQLREGLDQRGWSDNVLWF